MKTAVHKPRTGARTTCCTHSPQKGPTLPTMPLGPEPPDLPCGTMHPCCLSHPGGGTLSRQMCQPMNAGGLVDSGSPPESGTVGVGPEVQQESLSPIKLLSRNNGPFHTLRLVSNYLKYTVVMTTGYEVCFQHLNLNMLQSPRDTSFGSQSRETCAGTYNTISQKPSAKGPHPFTHTLVLVNRSH